jgi:hypothetical protein
MSARPPEAIRDLSAVFARLNEALDQVVSARVGLNQDPPFVEAADHHLEEAQDLIAQAIEGLKVRPPSPYTAPGIERIR